MSIEERRAESLQTAQCADASVWYCYAVTRNLPAAALDGLRGLQGALVEPVTFADLTVVAGPVPLGQFGETALRAKLEDLAWLEEVARRHDDVVGEIARHGATLPFRLATLYLDQHRVRTVLETGHARISAALDRVDGRVEWGVKVYADLSKPVPAAVASAAGDDRPGRSYLRKRLTEQRSKDEAWQSAVQAADEVDTALSELAEERRAHRPQSAELSGEAGVNALNVAYLVPDGQGDRFLALAGELRAAARGCRIEVTGPWAPYSFGLPDLSAGPDAPG
ncbi:GvpL/GvpF family gas vesicle protein [Amycolatopsis minnesotensis]|uniref:GvpL/GvpF family gas vesicle protein n=1 Tax=Amycolatopsis minnesotensis TaxID=337894 RepID=A0ABP5BQS9_9PSEU